MNVCVYGPKDGGLFTNKDFTGRFTFEIPMEGSYYNDNAGRLSAMLKAALGNAIRLDPIREDFSHPQVKVYVNEGASFDEVTKQVIHTVNVLFPRARSAKAIG